MWARLESSGFTLVQHLEGDVHSQGDQLPPDWATVSSAGVAAPSGRQFGTTPVYGLDAQRLPIWMATSCTAEGRHLAAVEWPALRSAAGGGGRVAYTLSGQPLSGLVNPLGYVAAAAAADAAGQRSAAASLLDRADAQDASYRTYYGAAWVALGRVLLDTSWLSPCPPGQ